MTEQNPIDDLESLVEEIGEHSQRLASVAQNELAAPQEIAETVMPLLFDLAQTMAAITEMFSDEMENIASELDEPDSQLLPEDAALFRKHLLWVRETIQAAQAAYVDETEQGRVALAEMDVHLRSANEALERIDEIEIRDENDRPPAPVVHLQQVHPPPASTTPQSPPPATEQPVPPVATESNGESAEAPPESPAQT